MITQGSEIERFKFGENWSKFLDVVDNSRVEFAVASLSAMLNVETLKGKSFLDIGSGSGLFSLAARLLGASVHSFDYDPQSVGCTAELRSKYFADDPQWIVEQGSILDEEYLSKVGKFDIVYSWGVLHHTGAMWQALEHVLPLVSTNGQLFIAIYNDQGAASHTWAIIKKAYNRLPPGLRWAVVGLSLARLWGPTMIRDVFRGKPFSTWMQYKGCGRGMSAWRDMVDWVGGYPFEVARPEEIFAFYRRRGLVLERLKTCGGGHGCNEFVFRN